MARLAGDGPSPLPPGVWRWGAGFLGVSLASLVLSVARGETLYLLLRGRVDPLIVNSLGMTAAERSGAAVRVFLSLVLSFLAVEAFARVARKEKGRQLLLAAASSGALLAGLAVLLGRWVPIDANSGYWASIGRTSGTFTDPNALGVGLALLALLAAGAVASLRGALRWLALAALAVAPLALERSGSRSALLVLVGGAAAAAVGGYRAGGQVRRAVLAVGVLAAALAAGTVLLAPRGGPAAAGGLWARLGGALSAPSMDELVSSRPLFWQAAFATIEAEPLTGCGLGGFPFEFPTWYEKSRGPAVFTDNATSAFLDVAAESGLPALLLGLAAVTPFLVRAFETLFGPFGAAPWSSVAGAASVAGLFAASFTGSHLRFPEVALLAALAAAFLVFPPREAAGREETSSAPKRLLPVLAAAGVIGAALAAAPTLRSDAPFRHAGPGWIGVWNPEARGASGRRWTGAKICRRTGAHEEQAAVTLENVRPDGRPVLVEVRLDGTVAGTVVLPAAEKRILTLRPAPPSGKVLSIAFSPTFVPAQVQVSSDRRTLGVQLTDGRGR